MNNSANDTAVPASGTSGTAENQSPPIIEGQIIEVIDTEDDMPASSPSSSDQAAASDAAPAQSQPEFDSLYALTSLVVGLGVEGTSVLLERLKRYEAEIREDRETIDELYQAESPNDRLRYLLIGFLFEQQSWFRRYARQLVKLTDQSLNLANRASRPVLENRVANPITDPLRRRYNRLVRNGESSVQRWVQIGRENEPESRLLASKTYQEIIDEFIQRLADNEELQDLVAQQSLGLASEVRDEIRERTVTGDNVLEGIVRRMLRRTPRTELPPPSPQVQGWAQATHEDRRERE